MQNQIFWQDKNFQRAAVAIAILFALFMAVKLAAELKGLRYVGAGVSAANTVSVTGEGEVFAVPDIANISFSVRHEGKTVADTQKVVTDKMNAALAFLSGAGIEERDIKTTSYNAYPQYNYNEVVCMGTGCPKPGTRVLTGYEVSQTIAVKVRDTAKVGVILEGIAKAGISDISGPNFAIDDDEALKQEARKIAIEDAREKAKVLAKDLRVRLVRIVAFNEGGNYPIYYSKVELAADGRGGATAPQIPAGENKILSTVTITYEIR